MYEQECDTLCCNYKYSITTCNGGHNIKLLPTYIQVYEQLIAEVVLETTMLVLCKWRT